MGHTQMLKHTEMYLPVDYTTETVPTYKHVVPPSEHRVNNMDVMKH